MTPGEQELLRQLRRDAAREAVVGTAGGVGEGLLSLGSGIAAQVPAGLHGAASFAKHLLTGQGIDESARRASKNVRRTQEALTYQPQSDLGQRGMQNVGAVIEPVAETLKETFVDPVGMRSPAAGAAMLAGFELVGPRKPKAPKLRTDPGSPQALLPGVEALTEQQAYQQALRARNTARERASFDDPNAGIRYDYDPEAVTFRAHPWTRPEDVPALSAVSESTGEVGSGLVGPMYTGGDRPASRISRGSEATATYHIPENMQDLMSAQRGAHDVARRMLEKSEAAQGAQASLERRVVPAAREEAAATTRQLERLREAREATLDPDEAVALEREIYHTLRGKPLLGGGAWRAPPVMHREGVAAVSHPHPSDYEPLPGAEAAGYPGGSMSDPALAARTSALHEQQARLVQALREQREIGDTMRAPEPVVPEWVRNLTQRESGAPVESAPADREWWEAKLGVGPDAMNREAVAAFLKEAQSNPDILQYGTMPEGTSIEDFAKVFGRRAGKRIRVEWEGGDGDSDEPYKIKREKEHGRGEVMRDRWGDPKMEEFEAGEPLRSQDTGDIKKKVKEVELFGPVRPGDPGAYRASSQDPLMLMGEKKIPKLARGGEMRVDEEGNPVYRKSEGGEPMLDERGRPKYEEVENPDYRGESEGTVLRLEVPGEGHITTSYGEGQLPATHATGAGKVGAVLYQTLLAHASRAGEKHGSYGLTGDNALRLLSNTLANYARTGVNPRHVGGTQAGKGKRAEGFAEGPELWRAEANEAAARLEARRANPEDLSFNPQSGFSIKGKPATSEDIKAALSELSPDLKYTKVGEKTLMRRAVFDWLRGAEPGEAAKVAREWKKYGPLFGMAGISLGALQEMTTEGENGGDT